MKIPIDEFIEQVKDEILCYEDMEKVAEQWEVEFKLWMQQNKKNKDLVKTSKGIAFNISDESDIFEVADSYVEALESGERNKYWNEF